MYRRYFRVSLRMGFEDISENSKKYEIYLSKKGFGYAYGPGHDKVDIKRNRLITS